MKQNSTFDEFKQGLKDRKRGLRRQASGQLLSKYGKRSGAHSSSKRTALRDFARAEDAMEELKDENCTTE